MNTTTVTKLESVYHSCSARVYSSGYSIRGRSCSHKATVCREIAERVYPPVVKVYDEETFTFTEQRGEPTVVMKPTWFCRTHDPVAQNERADRKRQEQREEWERRVAYENAARAKAEARTAALKALVDAARAYVDASDNGNFDVQAEHYALAQAVRRHREVCG
jgi:hypothetical protein